MIKVIWGNKLTMTNRMEWEKKGKRNACRLCGQFIDNQEAFYLVVVPFPHTHEQFSNFIVHDHEWEDFTEGITEVSAIFEKLSVTTKPFTHNHTVPNMERVEAFKRALRKKGCVSKKETANRIYFIFSGRSTLFYFEKRFEYIDNTKLYNDMIERFFILENVSRLEEEWKKELGEIVKEGFRTEKHLNNLKKYPSLIISNYS